MKNKPSKDFVEVQQDETVWTLDSVTKAIAALESMKQYMLLCKDLQTKEGEIQ